jgi:hypothetical protein
MGLIEKILDLYEGHAKTLTSILLGVLVAGMVGGGLWINSLKDSLAEQKTIHAERYRLIEERYRTALVELSSEYETATSAFAKLKQDVLDGIAAIESGAVSLDVSRAPTTRRKIPATTLQDLVAKARALRQRVENSSVPKAPNAERILHKVEDYRYPPEPRAQASEGLPSGLFPAIVALLIAYVLILGISWGTWRVLAWASRAVSSALIRRSYLRKGIPLDFCIREPMSFSDANHLFEVRGAFGKKERRHWNRLKRRLKMSDDIHAFAVPEAIWQRSGADRGVIVLRGRRILGLLLEVAADGT